MSADRIDTHQHYVPPAYRQLMADRNLTVGGWPLPAWDAQAALAVMDREEITTAILSLSAPGARLSDDDAEARRLAREVNEYGAELAKDRPDRFGHFATVPLPDVDGALEEAVYALDTLGADGIVVLSNADGHYLGEEMFEPLWAELEARSAVVFVHPTDPPLELLPGLPAPLVDYPYDTTRTAVHLVAHGVLRRHPNLTWILSHGGGFVPYAALRFSAVARFDEGATEESVVADLRRFWFDTALASTPYSLPSFLAFADPAHITFGSDYPFVPDSHPNNQSLDDWEMDGGLHRAINRGNAEVLFPRLKRP